jgi:hypothetical protein
MGGLQALEKGGGSGRLVCRDGRLLVCHHHGGHHGDSDHHDANRDGGSGVVQTCCVYIGGRDKIKGFEVG